MTDVNEDMVVDVVDDNDEAVDAAKRKDVLPEGLNFRTVHVFILDEKRNKILLQQLSKQRKRHPGYLGSSVAGYLFSGESYDQAAMRRTSQELDVEVNQSDLYWCGKRPMEDRQSTKFVELYSTVNEGPFTLDNDQVKSVEWVKISELDKLMQSDHARFTPTFEHVWNMFKESDYYNNRVKNNGL